MMSWKIVLAIFAKFLLYSLIVILIDTILIVSFTWGIDHQTKYSLSFVMLLEGGIGLIVGGAVALYSPSVSKMREVLFHFEPWSFERQKQIGEEVKPLIITGFILIGEALLLSAM